MSIAYRIVTTDGHTKQENEGTHISGPHNCPGVLRKEKKESHSAAAGKATAITHKICFKIFMTVKNYTHLSDSYRLTTHFDCSTVSGSLDGHR